MSIRYVLSANAGVTSGCLREHFAQGERESRFQFRPQVTKSIGLTHLPRRHPSSLPCPPPQSAFWSRRPATRSMPLPRSSIATAHITASLLTVHRPGDGWSSGSARGGCARLSPKRTDLVGFATTVELPASLRLGHFWHLRDLFVLPTHRRHGIARALLASVRSAALDAGAIRLVLQTEDEHNDPAIQLYEDSGSGS